VVTSFLFLALADPNLAAESPSVKGGKLPVINLPIPKDQNERNYLGLSRKGYFKIPEIKAQAVIVAILSLYCPTCQATASAMTEVYRRIENNPDLKGKMKLIGIGAGNSPHEVEVLKEAYNIPFPLFPDKDFSIHKALGEVRTPYFIAIKMNGYGDGSHDVVHTRQGSFAEPEPFLEAMLEVFGLKRKDSPERTRDFANSFTN
jgi:hypothetical protein